MKKSTAEFGKAKPLPGQAGYKVSTTEVLESEAKEMELRLRALQERMQQEQLADSAVVKKGGSRWRSARTDKGSVTSYAKDVQEKYKKKSAADGGGDPVMRAPASVRRAARETMAAETFSSKEVGVWAIADVTDWLNSIALGQYAEVFAQNEISGPILLDISLEDLDYMGISILGHRKVILKGVEDLRTNKRVTISLTAQGGADPSRRREATSQSTNSILTNGTKLRSQTTDDCGEERKLLSSSFDSSNATGVAKEDPGKKATHWSHLEPLSSQPVKGSAGPMVNPADGVLDEEAEREAFRDAVMEWRRGNVSGPVAIVRGGQVIRPGGETKKASSGANTATATDMSDDLDDFSGKTGGQQDGLWHNPFASQDTNFSESPRADTGYGSGANSFGPRATPDSRQQAYSLKEGVLDEESEHAEFVRAVEAWRNGSPRPASASVKSTVDKLRQELEEQQQESVRRLQREKEEAMQRLQASLDAQRRQAESSGADGKVSIAVSDLNDEDSDEENYYGSGSGNGDQIMSSRDSKEAKLGSASRSPRVWDHKLGYADGDDMLSPLNSDDEDYDFRKSLRGSPRPGSALAESKVEFALVESTLGIDKLVDDGRVNTEYFVDEGSSDEEK